MSGPKPALEGSTHEACPMCVYDLSDETRRTWERDYSNVCEALQPHVRTLPDGFAYVDEDSAPAAMVRLYRALVEVGDDRGWMP